MASKQNGPQPTPISVITTLFTRPNQPPLVINGMEKIDIKQQIQMLNPDKCGTRDGRNEIVRKMDGYTDDLRTNAFKRIRFKSMLCEYHKHYYRIKEKHFEMIKNWNDKDFALNVIVHFIQHSDDQAQESAEKEQKRLNTTWRFLDYLTQYFDKKGFNGQEFIEKYIPNKNNDGQGGKKTSGFGLTIVKEVCKQFEQKTGQYTKVKKQLTAWAKKNAERHQQEVKFDLEEIKDDEELYKEPQVAGHSKSLTEAFEKKNAKEIAASKNNNNAQESKSNNIGQQNNNSYGGGGGGISGSGIGNGLGKKAGEKWYWFCDEGGIKWVPYKDEHQDIIEDAWCKEKSNVIVMERFKIDFHRDNSNNGVASGQQYNYQIHNSWRRGVIRGKPDPKTMLLNDIPCDAHPR